jgi:hypothetical protein
MQLIPINDVGQVGIVKDTPPYQLPPNVWSGGNNVRFLDNGVKKCAGYEEVFATLPFGAYYIHPFLDNGGTYHWLAFGLNNVAVWTGSAWLDITRQKTGQLNGALSATDTTIVLDDTSYFPSSGTIAIGTNETGDASTNLYEEITYGANNTGTNTLSTLTVANAHPDNEIVTPVGTTATGDNPYSATSTQNWRVTLLNGLLVATNGYDTTQMWPLSSGVPSRSTPLRELKNWPATTSYCKSVSAFRTFLVGLNWQIGGVEYPNLVKWSTEASALSPPNTWLESDAVLDAGEYQLTDTPGKIIDGLPFGDSFLIYKEDSIYIMNYVGTPYIFSFKLLSPTIGLLAKNAVAEFEGGHFFIGNSDCYVTNGQQVTALLPNKLRREMFSDLNGDNYEKVFVAADYARNEMLACYPAGISSIPNKAIIWNWKDNTFSLRGIPDLYHINSGIAAITTGTTWNDHSEAWNAGAGIWGTGNYDNVLKNLVFAKPDYKADISGATAADPVVITSSAHGLADSDLVSISGVVGMTEINAKTYYAKVTGYSTTTFGLYSDSALTTTVDGSGYTAYSSGGKIDMPKLYRDDRGNQEDGSNMTSFIERTGYDLGDPSSQKFVSAVWPKLEVTGDNTINVYVGRQMSTEDGIDWNPDNGGTPIPFNPNTQSKVSCRITGKFFAVKFETDTDVDWKLHGVEFEVTPRGKRGSRSYV